MLCGEVGACCAGVGLSPDLRAERLAGPFAALLLSGQGSLEANLDQVRQLISSVKWEARDGITRLGVSAARTYRLEGRFLDRYRAVVFVSRAGEVLRVELPNDITLTNDQLVPLQ